jgi:hypothetical protein
MKTRSALTGFRAALREQLGRQFIFIADLNLVRGRIEQLYRKKEGSALARADL